MIYDDIPERAYAVYSTPLDIDTIGDQLAIHSLQCSGCDVLFDDEIEFAVHADQCLRGVELDTHHEVHKHANRLLMFQQRVALFCGASQEPVLECGLCNTTLPDRETLRRHIRACSRHSARFQRYVQETGVFFNCMLSSYEKLGFLFQEYVTDSHIEDIREQRKQRILEGEPPYIGSNNRHLFFNEIEEHFVEQYQDYLSAVTTLIYDSFLYYLKKGDTNRSAEEVLCPLPINRQGVQFLIEREYSRREAESQRRAAEAAKAARIARLEAAKAKRAAAATPGEPRSTRSRKRRACGCGCGN
ncbi:unnamed protein product [Caenorhabditis nigoni]